MWKTVKLGDVCDFQNGFAFKSSLFKKDGNPILRISNIQQDKIDVKNLVYFSEHDYNVDFKRYRVEKGDLLIAMSGATTGKLGFNFTNHIFYMNQRVGKFTTKENLNKKYLYYLLSTKVKENLSISKGAAQPNLSTEQIKSIEFLLPPLAEQQRIVTKLDVAFSEIDKAIEVTSSRKLQSERLLEKMLSDEFCSALKKQSMKFADVCTLQRGFDLPKSQRQAGSIPLFSANGITDYINVAKITAPGVITGRSGTIGSVHYTEKEFWALNTALYVKDFKGNLPKYVFYFLKSFDLKKYASGAGVPTLNRNVLSDEIVWIADERREQQRTCEKLDESTEQVSCFSQILNEQIVNYQALKSAILAQELQSESA